MVRVKIEKPPIPIIFIDTFFFIDLANCKATNSLSHKCQKIQELYDLIKELARSKKLLCPMGDQEEEYELGNKNIEEIRKYQIMLSYGIRTIHRQGIYNYQVALAMKAFIEDKNSFSVSYRGGFYRDPVEELEQNLQQPFTVNTNISMPSVYLDKRRKTKKELADDFERLRQKVTRRGIKYEVWVGREERGIVDVIKNTSMGALKKLNLNEHLSEEERNSLLVLSELLAFYSHYSGRQVSIPELLDFLKSGHYAAIPYVSIRSKLYASLLTREKGDKFIY